MNLSRTSRWPTTAEPARDASTPARPRLLWRPRWLIAPDALAMRRLNCTERFRAKWPTPYIHGCLVATSAKRCALGTAMLSPTKSPYSTPELGLNGRSTIGVRPASLLLMQPLGSLQQRVPGRSVFNEMSLLGLDPKISLLDLDLYGLKDPVGAAVVGEGNPMHLLGVPACIKGC
jgi:hypothetical protein